MTIFHGTAPTAANTSSWRIPVSTLPREFQKNPPAVVAVLVVDTEQMSADQLKRLHESEGLDYSESYGFTTQSAIAHGRKLREALAEPLEDIDFG